MAPRDEDDDERSYGAEDAYYRSRGFQYECKDEPFENVEELLLLRGMSPDLYRDVAPHVTVFGSGQLNLNTADDAALRALGLSHAFPLPLGGGMVRRAS